MEEVIREGALRLLTSETACDAVISCSGRRMMAHKIVLSIASPLLRDLLIEDAHAEPAVLIFPETSGYTMSLVLDYIYTGNVTIPPVYIEEFLSIANQLKLKLDGDDDDEDCCNRLRNDATPIPMVPHQSFASNRKDDRRGRTCAEDLSDDGKRGGKRAKDVVSIDDIISDNYKTLRRNNRFDAYDREDVKCKRGKPMPSLLPIGTAHKRRRELLNKVLASPWRPRESPVLRHPREDCHDLNVAYPSFHQPQHCEDKEENERGKDISQENDSNNNNYNHSPYAYETICSNNNDQRTITPKTTLQLPVVSLNDRDQRSDSQTNDLLIDKEPSPIDNEHPLAKRRLNDKEKPTAAKNDNKLKPFKCEDCGKAFSQLRNYKYHRSIHEGTREFSAKCQECGKVFNDKAYLSSHMKIHRDKKEYACPHCPKRFNQRVAYNMHLRIHTGVKPHECQTCGKSFSRKMLLKQHQRVHTGERPYTCPECGKSFADRSNMSLHARLHTGVKPYACTLCPKSFTKKHHLKTHMNFHTGLKPYTCQNCGLAFSQSSNMRTHYKKCILKETGTERRRGAQSDGGN